MIDTAHDPAAESALAFVMGLLDAGRYPRPQGREGTLQRIRDLLERLDHPQRGLAAVLVAGTKGKGSTAAMLAAIERAAGRSVGLYVKPHLTDYRERIQVDGAVIAPRELAVLVDQVRPHVEVLAGGPLGAPTYFEVSVALALLHFSRRAVDLAILEVGLGGRLDATNAVDPIVSVIAPISFDHTEVLGTSLESIAREKAGIMRPERPVVIAPQVPEVARTLKEACAAVGASPVRVADRVRWSTGAISPEGERVALWGRRPYGEIHLPLVGRHQAVNAAAAVAAAEELEAAGFPITAPDVRTGLEGLRWPGRIEVVARRPTVIVDVAHNAASMQALRDALVEAWPRRRMILVFGMVATHDHEEPTAIIAPLADAAVVTEPRHVRPLPPERLAATVRRFVEHVEVIPDRAAAVSRALALAGPDDVVCITGSFYLAGEARAIVLDRSGSPAPVAARATAVP